MNDGKRQVTDETEPDENPIATIYYENGTELTGEGRHPAGRDSWSQDSRRILQDGAPA